MRTPSLLMAVAASAALAAQSPLSLPFDGNIFLSGAAGTFFDLNVTQPNGVTILGLDVHCFEPAGTAGGVEFYTTPGTYIGRQTNPGVWTLRASGSVTAAGLSTPSRACFGSGGVFLAQGSHGIFVRQTVVGVVYSQVAGTVTVSNNAMVFTGGQGAMAATPFTSNPFPNRRFNGNIYYSIGNSPGASCAIRTLYGSGCGPNNADSFYEWFAQLQSFDLSGAPGNETVIVATPIGPSGYALTFGAPAWFTPAAPKVLSNHTNPQPMGDDTMSGPLTLPFPFTYPAGTVTVIHANANGFLHLGPTGSTVGDWSPTVPELLSLQPRLFPLWGDWQPATNVGANPASGVYFDVDPSGQTVYFTWLDVADRRGQVPAPGATSLTFQVAIHADNRIEFRYRSILPAVAGNGAVIVGYSKGNNNIPGGPASVDPGPRDLSAAIPFATNGPDAVNPPLLLDSNTPQLGQTWSLTTANIEPISPLAITFLGNAPVNPGLDLGFLGAPGCRASIDAILGSLSAPNLSGSATAGLPIPNNATLIGATLSAQSVALTLRNALNLRTSNGVSAGIGL